jgi:hypothetical protein
LQKRRQRSSCFWIQLSSSAETSIYNVCSSAANCTFPNEDNLERLSEFSTLPVTVAQSPMADELAKKKDRKLDLMKTD